MRRKKIKVVIGLPRYERLDAVVPKLRTMYDVETISDSEEAYHTIHVFKPDVAVLDFALSKIHPIELYEGIALAHPYVNFILCGTEDNFQIAQRVWKQRACDFIYKPFTPDQFVANINRIVRNIINVKEIEQLKQYIGELEAKLAGPQGSAT